MMYWQTWSKFFSMLESPCDLVVPGAEGFVGFYVSLGQVAVLISASRDEEGGQVPVLLGSGME